MLYSTVSDYRLSKGDEDNHIQIFVNNERCISIFSSQNMLQFIYQLLGSFNQFSPADILQTLKIPNSSELDEIINEENDKQTILKEFHTKSDQLINKIITELIR